MIVAHQNKAEALGFYFRRYVSLSFLVVLTFDAIVAFAYLNLGWTWVALPHIPLSLFGSAIGVLVGFRLSAAYARWWEARQLWGSVVNDSRTLARQALNNLGESAARERIVHLQIAYVQALRMQLRKQDVAREIRPWADAADLPALEGQANVALSLQTLIGAELQTAREKNKLSEFSWMQMDETLTRLMNSQGGLERIKNTPMQHQYVNLLRLFVGVYAVLLPFGLIQNLQMMTPIGSSALAIIFLTLNRLGAEIETPFENRPSDVPLTAITTTIEIGLRQMLGEKNLPPPTPVVDGVLW